MKKNQIF